MYCNPTITNDAKTRISLHTARFFVILYRYLALLTYARSAAQKYKNCRLSAYCSHNNEYGGLTEWLRSSPGKRVRCNSPAGSSPVSSARIQRPVSGLFFIEISTFYTFLYRQIHPIKKCPKGALRAHWSPLEPHNRFSDAQRYGMKFSKKARKT